MYQQPQRYKTTKRHTQARFNHQVNSTKRLNKTLNKRGGIKL